MTDHSSSASSIPPTGGDDKPPRRIRRWRFAAVFGVIGLSLTAAGLYNLIYPARAPGPVGVLMESLTGANPHPVHLVRPRARPLSALAQLGQQIFFDPSLSQSGQQSCASCHSPEHAYGPPNGLATQLGGAHMTEVGLRAAPSLAYLYRQPAFSIGPDAPGGDAPPAFAQVASQAQGSPRPAKVAGAPPAVTALIPQGGLFWDGRSNTLQDQATGPLMNPLEMANTSEGAVAAKLAKAKYANLFKPLFGPYILQRPGLLVAEAMSALARYQVEDPSFHAFDSKYDAWLEGKARFTPAELRGYRLFNDKTKANCGGCHLSQPTADGLPPLFTDTQYEALGLPRNPEIAANKDPKFFDMGLCGPVRTDLVKQTQYCGMFLTPTLRNTATRTVFFHNGVYHSLSQVLAFYNQRDTSPGRTYPRNSLGGIVRYNDLPVKYQSNIDTTDAPFDRRPGGPPAMGDRDMADIIAFLKTLDDQPQRQPKGEAARGRGGPRGFLDALPVVKPSLSFANG
jgi:cytochrome c peroxidase